MQPGDTEVVMLSEGYYNGNHKCKLAAGMTLQYTMQGGPQ